MGDNKYKKNTNLTHADEPDSLARYNDYFLDLQKKNLSNVKIDL
jgi:hypothetical protein